MNIKTKRHRLDETIAWLDLMFAGVSGLGVAMSLLTGGGTVDFTKALSHKTSLMYTSTRIVRGTADNDR